MLLTLSDYPAPTWSLSLALAGVDTLTVTSTPNGAAHALSFTAGQTAALGAGVYQYRVRATDGTTVTTIQSNVTTVVADLGTLVPGEIRESYWATLKKAAEDALVMLMAGGAVQMATIMGRQTMFRSPTDCLKVIATCEARLLASQSGTFGTPIHFNVVGMR
jgi:hypothetical protein